MFHVWNTILREWWVAPDVTENEKIGPENRADDIKNDDFDRKNTGESAG